MLSPQQALWKELLITKPEAPGILLPPPQAPGSGKLCPQGTLTPTGDLQAFSLFCSCSVLYISLNIFVFKPSSPRPKPATRFGDQHTPVWHDYCQGTSRARQGVVVHWFRKKRYTYSALSALRELNTALHEKDLDGLHTDKTASNWGHSSKTEHSPSTHKALASVLSTAEKKNSNKYHRANTININNWRENLSMG